MACAMTVSNGEGNGQMAPGLGFMPNNMLGEEDVNPAGATDFPENVRMSSMMAPTLAEDARGRQVVLGSGGSNRIRSALLLTLARLLLRGEELAQAVAAPRLHVEDGALDVEPGLTEAEVAQLRAQFEAVRVWSKPSMFFGGVHAVLREADGTLSAVGDFRREGVGLIL
jgi:gamma-glutamyltranspeptidase/glutathione hydrolase